MEPPVGNECDSDQIDGSGSSEVGDNAPSSLHPELSAPLSHENHHQVMVTPKKIARVGTHGRDQVEPTAAGKDDSNNDGGDDETVSSSVEVDGQGPSKSPQEMDQNGLSIVTHHDDDIPDGDMLTRMPAADRGKNNDVPSGLVTPPRRTTDINRGTSKNNDDGHNRSLSLDMMSDAAASSTASGRAAAVTPNTSTSGRKSAKVPCRYGRGCSHTSAFHRSRYSHPTDAALNHGKRRASQAGCGHVGDSKGTGGGGNDGEEQGREGWKRGRGFMCNECGMDFGTVAELQLHMIRKTAWSNQGLIGCRVSCLVDNREWHEGLVTQVRLSYSILFLWLVLNYFFSVNEIPECLSPCVSLNTASVSLDVVCV